MSDGETTTSDIGNPFKPMPKRYLGVPLYADMSQLAPLSARVAEPCPCSTGLDPATE